MRSFKMRSVTVIAGAFLAILVLVLVSAGVFFRIHCYDDAVGFRHVMRNCHPVWRPFAWRRFSAGDSVADLVSAYPPTAEEQLGPYTYLEYGVRHGFEGSHGLSVVAKDSRLFYAGANGPRETWKFVFFCDEAERVLFSSEWNNVQKDRKAQIQTGGSDNLPLPLQRDTQ